MTWALASSLNICAAIPDDPASAIVILASFSVARRLGRLLFYIVTLIRAHDHRTLLWHKTAAHVTAYHILRFDRARLHHLYTASAELPLIKINM